MTDSWVYLSLYFQSALAIFVSFGSSKAHCLEAGEECKQNWFTSFLALSMSRLSFYPHINIIPAYTIRSKTFHNCWSLSILASTALQYYIQPLAGPGCYLSFANGVVVSTSQGNNYGVLYMSLIRCNCLSWYWLLSNWYWPLYKYLNSSNIVADDAGLPRIRYNPNHIAECLFKTFHLWPRSRDKQTTH